MTDCNDGGEERELPEIPSGGGDYGIVSDQPGTQLLRRLKTSQGRSNVPALTLRRDCDEHTALTRGLAEYIYTLKSTHRGRLIRPERVTYDYPDRESAGEAVFPAVAVYASGDGEYSSNLASPIAREDIVVQATTTERAITVSPMDTYMLDELRVEVECQDAEQRIGMRMMLVDELRPVPGSLGLSLILPHYHSTVATYALTKASMPDSPDSVEMGIRPLALTLSAYIQVYRVHRLATLVQVRTPGTIGGGNR
jgi:hypothetical protein